MKNLVKSAFVALVVCVFAIPASAESLMIAPVNVQDTVVKKDTVVKEEAPMLLAQEKVVIRKGARFFVGIPVTIVFGCGDFTQICRTNRGIFHIINVNRV